MCSIVRAYQLHTLDKDCLKLVAAPVRELWTMKRFFHKETKEQGDFRMQKYTQTPQSHLKACP